MKVVVTGAGGLLGAHTVSLMGAIPGCEVIAVTSQGGDQLRDSWFWYGISDVAFSAIEIVPTNRIINVLPSVGDVHWLVNCGFPRNLGGTRLAEGLDFQHELIATAEAAHNVRRLINISSQSVYSSTRRAAASEDSDLDLDSSYAVAKYATELMADRFAVTKAAVNIRLSSLIGVGFDQRIVNRLARTAVETQSLKVTSPDQVFDFMDVRDAAAALQAVMTASDGPKSRVLNVGSGRPYTLREIALVVQQVLADHLAIDVNLIDEPTNPAYSSSSLDCTRLRDEYGFSASTSLYASVLSIVESLPLSAVRSESSK